MLIKPFSSGCNMRCRYCFYADVSAHREVKNFGKMPLQTVDRLLEAVFAVRPKLVSFAFQGGEPTLAGLDYFRYFTEQVKQMNDCFARVSYSLQTNGLVLDAEFARFLAANNFLVGLSLDGNKYVHDKNRVDAAGAGTFRRVMDTAALLKKYGVKFNILSVVTDASAGLAAETYEFFKKCGFSYLQFIACIDDFGSDKTSLSAEAYAEFLKRLFDRWHDDVCRGVYLSVRAFDNYVNVLRGLSPENCAMSGVCGNYFVIEGDGSVYPCDFYCTDEYRTGSVFDDEPFGESSVQREFVEQSRAAAEACKACEYFSLCRGGCRRDREPDLQTNRFCAAYKSFFDYAAEKMKKLAIDISSGKFDI